MFDFEDEEPEDNYNLLGMTTLEELQTYALGLFGRYLKKLSNSDALPDMPPDSTERFLPLTELECILRDYGQEGEEGYSVGGDTLEEAKANLNKLMFAILQRILSNVLQSGVEEGLLDCEFNADANDFQFCATEKGIEKYGGKTD